MSAFREHKFKGSDNNLINVFAATLKLIEAARIVIHCSRAHDQSVHFRSDSAQSGLPGH